MNEIIALPSINSPKLVYVVDILKNIYNTILHVAYGKIINWCLEAEGYLRMRSWGKYKHKIP